MKRWFGVAWGLACIAVAFYVAVEMLVGFAPTGGSVDPVSEIAGLERGRRFWWAKVWIAAALLAASGITIAVLAWRRTRQKS